MDIKLLGFPGGSDSKESACNEENLDSISGSGRSPWRREKLPTPVFLHGEFQAEGPSGLQSMGLQRVEHDSVTNTQNIY